MKRENIFRKSRKATVVNKAPRMSKTAMKAKKICKAFEEEAGLPKNITYFTPDDSLSSFMKSLFGAAKKLTPKSETDLAQDIIENKGNGVLKYYAE